jgi:hypothetical protein
MAFSILAAIIRPHIMNYIDLSAIIDTYKMKSKRIKSNAPPNQAVKKKASPALQMKFVM